MLLRYAVQKGWAVLPKSVNEDRIAENLEVGDGSCVFSLERSDMQSLDALECGAAFAFGGKGEAFDPVTAA